jgi:hypothetical protein
MTIKSFTGKSSNAADQNFVSLVLGALVLLPGIIAGLILYTQRLPFPLEDDYKALLAFAYQYEHASGPTAKALQIAVSQYNSYRLIFMHGVVAAELGLTHHLSFGFLTAFGDLFLLGIFGLLWYSFERTPSRSKLLYFLPVSLIFFSMSYWETLNWAMTSLQQIPVIFFAFLALYLLSPRKTADLQKDRFFFSCIAALLSCCSSPNGFLLAPIGVLMLASRHRYKLTILWLCSFILPFCAYLYYPVFEPAQHRSHLKQLFYFVAFFGGAFRWRPLAFLVGIALLSILLWAARARFTRQNTVFFPFALWIVLTGALVEAIRTSVTSRYSIYSVMMLVCCYSFVLHELDQELLSRKRGLLVHINRRRFLEIAIASSFCFYVATAIWASHHLHHRREMVLKGLTFYRSNPLTNSPQMNPAVDLLFPDEKPFELFMLKRAAKEGFYTVPSIQDLRQ